MTFATFSDNFNDKY